MKCNTGLKYVKYLFACVPVGIIHKKFSFNPSDQKFVRS